MEMRVVLGIDAAWTPEQPSGVGLVKIGGGRSQCLAVAPSYESFVGTCRRVPVDWFAKPSAGKCDPGLLLGAAEDLAGRPVDIVSVDMPISIGVITTRREADQAVSREFGSRKCSTHSPNSKRPGRLGQEFSSGFESLGYKVATASPMMGGNRALIEAYPHVGLLSLMRSESRVEYKVGKSSTYWPSATRDERINKLKARHAEILDALQAEFGPIDLPRPPVETTLAGFKKYEDAIDALVCCWIGALHSNGKAVPLGDASAAIWCPKDVLRTNAE